MDLTEVHGTAHYIIVLELCAAALLSMFVAAFAALSGPRGLPALWEERAVFSKVFFCLLLFLVFYGQWFSGGSPIAAVGPAMPGSLVTRSYSADLPLWLRRLLEPSLWLLIISLRVAARDAHSRRGARLYRAASLLLCSIIFFESLLLITPVYEAANFPGHGLWARWVHFVSWQIFIVLLIFGLLADLLRRKSSSQPAPRHSERRFVERLGLAFSLLILVSFAVEKIGRTERPLLMGAHYYSWFPENWRGGFSGEMTEPPVLPSLGLYRSADRAVFDQHVAWSKEATLDFLIFDWWPQRPDLRHRIYRHIVKRDGLQGLRFAMHYESLDVKEQGDRSFPGEGPNVAYMTAERSYRLKKHWEFLAKHYMREPGYLRINGRPVLFIYASRHLVGPVEKAIAQARRHVEETTGLSLYLIGDEVFFNALTFDEQHGLRLLPAHQPDWNRLSAFDAVTGYNPYDESRSEHGGSEGAQLFIRDVEQLYKAYRAHAATAGVRFVPSVIAGYNDRGIRPKEDHYVIPRVFDGKNFLEEALNAWALPTLDRDYPLLAITSFNEWNEGSQIEPAAESPATRTDSSAEGDFYTQGEEYSGYGTAYLEILSRFRNRINSALGR